MEILKTREERRELIERLASSGKPEVFFWPRFFLGIIP